MSNSTNNVEPLDAVVEESIEIPNSGGARKSKLATSGDTIRFLYEDTKTLWDVIQRGCRLSGNGRCYGWRASKSGYSWVTYSEFIKLAENFGSGLVEIGIRPGQSSNVGICAQNCFEWVIVQYGCWSQSAVVVPLYDTLGPDASIFMIKQAEIQVVICDKEQKARNFIVRRKEIPTLKHIITTFESSAELNQLANDTDIKIHLFGVIENLGKNSPIQKLIPCPADTCLICYTSGTTGNPKGVVLTHENMVSAICSIKLMMGKSALTKEDVAISYLPLPHVFEQAVQVLTFLSGGSIGFFSGDITQLVDDMKVLQPTIFPSVPRLLNKLYNKAQAIFSSKLKNEVDDKNPNVITEKPINERSVYKPFLDGLGGKLRLVLSAAAPIYKNVLEFYSNALGCEIMEIYGQTECGGPCSLSLSTNFVGSVGSPVPCCVVKLVDVPDMGYLTKNSTGEVCVKGHNVFKGYLKDPELTAEVLDEEGWLHTGDIGMWLPNGTLKILDRKKNILKLSQGEYVAPEKIECLYSLSPFVSQVYVHGDSLKSFLVAIVVPEKETVLHWCKENSKGGEWNEICKDKVVKKLIFEDILRVGKSTDLNSFELVKDIHLHPEVMTFEAGFLTPTSKTKREVWKKHFSKEISVMCSNINEYN